MSFLRSTCSFRLFFEFLHGDNRHAIVEQLEVPFFTGDDAAHRRDAVFDLAPRDRRLHLDFSQLTL